MFLLLLFYTAALLGFYPVVSPDFFTSLQVGLGTEPELFFGPPFFFVANFDARGRVRVGGGCRVTQTV